MATSENPKIAEFRRVRDDVERARLCQAFVMNGERTMDAARRLRDESIRAARAKRKGGTRRELADAIGARLSIVVDALRVKR